MYLTAGPPPLGRSTKVTVAVSGHGHFDLISLIILLALLAVFALDVAGVIFVVRCNNRLSRAARGVVGGVSALTVFVATALFLQDVGDRGVGDWSGALATSAFVVLYGLIVCVAIFVLDSVIKRLRRPKTLGV